MEATNVVHGTRRARNGKRFQVIPQTLGKVQFWRIFCLRLHPHLDNSRLESVASPANSTSPSSNVCLNLWSWRIRWQSSSVPSKQNIRHNCVVAVNHGAKKGMKQDDYSQPSRSLSCWGEFSVNKAQGYQLYGKITSKQEGANDQSYFKAFDFPICLNFRS